MKKEILNIIEKSCEYVMDNNRAKKKKGTHTHGDWFIILFFLVSSKHDLQRSLKKKINRKKL